MIRTVKKGYRRFSPLIVGLNFSDIAVYKCIFNESWRYEPNKEDDWGKLFGWSFGLLPVKVDGKWVPAHQYNSIRVGIRYIPVLDCMELCLYTYSKGVRLVFEKGIYVPLHMEVTIELNTSPAVYPGVQQNNLVQANLKVICSNLTRDIHAGLFEDGIGYLTGTYFGGHDAELDMDTPAPHDISFEMIKIV